MGEEGLLCMLGGQRAPRMGFQMPSEDCHVSEDNPHVLELNI